MRAIFLAILGGLLLCGCSGGKVNREEAVDYYNTIQQTSEAEVKALEGFVSLMKKGLQSAQQNSPQKLDSLSISQIRMKYQELINLLDNDLMKMATMKEVDPEIDLKENLMKYLVFADTSFKQLSPDMFALLENGLETMTEERQKKFLEFGEAARREQSQRKKIEELSAHFEEKYDLMEK